MQPQKRRFRLSAVSLVLIIGLVSFIVYFYYYINPSQVVGILSKTNIVYYSSAFLVYALFAFFSAFVWRSLLKNVGIKINVWKALLFTWVGLFFEATVPQLGFSGEVSKTYLLNKDLHIGAGEIGASVIGQKILTDTLTVIAMALGLVLVLSTYPLPFTITFIISLILSLTILTTILIYVVSLKPSTTKTLLNWSVHVCKLFRKSWNPQNFIEKAQDLLGRFHVGMLDLTGKPKALVKPILFAILSFICEISVTFVVFIALGYPVPVEKVLVVFTLTGTLQGIAVSFFGFPELIMTLAFTALGIPTAVAFSVTLLTRIVTLWFRLIISYVALQWVGIKILRKQ